jgi:HSP20 family protein
MSSLLKWDPVREFEEFGRRLAPLFGRMGGMAVYPEENQSLTVIDWLPVVDIAEEDNAYLVTVELPQVKKEDTKLSVENGTLTISGSRHKEREEKEGFRFHRVERSYGTFMRSFTLPDDADSSKISASMKEGVLQVRIEKMAGSKAKSSEIEIR